MERFLLRLRIWRAIENTRIIINTQIIDSAMVLPDPTPIYFSPLT